MRPLWIKAALLIAAVWLVAGGVMLLARSSKATPESLARYLETHSVEGKSSAERAKVIDRVAKQLNGVDYEDRRRARSGRKLDGFFRSLTADEQARFLDLTLPTGFKQMMDAFNKMDPEKRKRMVDRALDDMRKRAGEEPARGSDDPHIGKIVNEGLRSFYSEANAEVKMDLAPLIEQMQSNLQGFR
jgi:hypothetical protein